MSETLLQEAVRIREQADLLVSLDEINQTLDRLAKELEQDIGNETPIFVCVMKGGLFVTSELMKRIQKPIELDYVHVDRYRNEISGSNIHWHKEPDISLNDRVVVLLDDIFDEGITLQELIAYFKAKGASRVISAVLLRKKLASKSINLAPDFIGMDIVDRYVFGCGMDYKGYWRNLHSIYAVSN